MIRIILSELVELNSEPGSPSNLEANSFELYCTIYTSNTVLDVIRWHVYISSGWFLSCKRYVILLKNK